MTSYSSHACPLIGLVPTQESGHFLFLTRGDLVAWVTASMINPEKQLKGESWEPEEQQRGAGEEEDFTDEHSLFAMVASWDWKKNVWK